jgi:hypothetical protein
LTGGYYPPANHWICCHSCMQWQALSIFLGCAIHGLLDSCSHLEELYYWLV